MPIKNKIELLTPDERKELEYMEKNGIGDNFGCFIKLQEKRREERLANMTPDERKAWDEDDARYTEKLKMFNGAF